MSAPRDPDTILAAWLEEGPSALPEPTRRAIAVATRTSPQSRWAIGLPWRPFTMNPFARTAVAVLAVVVVVGGAIYLLRPGNQLGTPGPSAIATPTPTTAPTISLTPAATASATPVPTPIDTTTWVPFTSDRHGYSMSVPADWSVVKATRPWLFGGSGDVPGDGTVDQFDQPSPGITRFVASGQTIPKGTSTAAWFTAYLTGTESMPAGCFPPRAQWTSITIAGHAAGLHGGLTSCGFTEAVAIVGNRAYVFTGYADRSAPSGRIFDRSLLDAWLSTVRFDPSKASDSPAPSPGPS